MSVSRIPRAGFPLTSSCFNFPPDLKTFCCLLSAYFIFLPTPSKANQLHFIGVSAVVTPGFISNPSVPSLKNEFAGHIPVLTISYYLR